MPFNPIFDPNILSFQQQILTEFRVPSHGISLHVDSLDLPLRPKTIRLTQIAIFASGEGTNAEAITQFFHAGPGKGCANVKVILTNRSNAGVIGRAGRLGIPVHKINRTWLSESAHTELKELGIDYIILAGFLLKLPPSLIQAFPDRIINIHPSLLPDFGGEGMYGSRVHEAVIHAQKSVSGITVHLVDEEYDHGRILFQAACDVLKDDSPESLAQKIHALEYQYYPIVIRQTICE